MICATLNEFIELMEDFHWWQSNLLNWEWHDSFNHEISLLGCKQYLLPYNTKLHNEGPSLNPAKIRKWGVTGNREKIQDIYPIFIFQECRSCSSWNFHLSCSVVNSNMWKYQRTPLSKWLNCYQSFWAPAAISTISLSSQVKPDHWIPLTKGKKKKQKKPKLLCFQTLKG
jgi:hypothetical protein